MWFSRKQIAQPQGQAGLPRAEDAAVPAASGQVTTKHRGDAAEALALDRLLKGGLSLVDANYKTPGRGGGEIDLIMRAPDGTLVFVEVRQRASSTHGGAGASISPVKQRRIIFAARCYLMRFASPPACRFDVVLVGGGLEEPGQARIEWLQGAFDAG